MTVTPFKGLIPYGEDDAPFFFGREHERAIISANLLAARLTLLYGQSGVGKSSVLRAGVVHELRELARQNLAERGEPDFAVLAYSSWRDDPMAGLTATVYEAYAATLNSLHAPPEPQRAIGGLIPLLEAWTKSAHGDLLIILDQFEEYFLYHDGEDGDGTFAVEFPRAVNRADLRVNFIVSLREDALSKLDCFKGRVPNLFDNYLRIEHLTREAARDAIEKPIAEYNRRLSNPADAVSIEPALVDEVLAQVQTGRVTLGRGGRGVVASSTLRQAQGADADARIETPYLQLVMTRLWDEEQRAGSHTLRLETLTRLKGAENIVRTHLDAVMDALTPAERDIAAEMFRYLVTPTGTKIAYTVADLAAYSQTDRAALAAVLEKLAGSELRILRTVEPPPDHPTESRYEIFHDVLAAAILDWRARYAQTQERAAAAQRLAKEQSRVTRLRLSVAGLAILVIVMFALAFYALRQKELSDAAQSAASQALDLVAQQDRAVPYFKAIMRGHTGGVRSAVFGPDGASVLSAGDDGAVYLWDARTGMAIHYLRSHAGGVYNAIYNADGKRALTVGADKFARLLDLSSGTTIAEVSPSRDNSDSDLTGADLSPDERTIATASTDGIVRLWDVSDSHLRLALQGSSGALSQVVFSSDGQLVAAGDADNQIYVWRVSDGSLVQTLKGHTGFINRLIFCKGGNLLSASDDGTARLWAPIAGTLLATITHDGPVKQAACSADGSLIVSGGNDRLAKVYSVNAHALRYTLVGHRDYISSLAISPDNRLLVTGSGDNSARVWDLSTGQTKFELRGHTSRINSVQFSPDSQSVVTGSEDKTVRVWDINVDQPVVELRGHTDRVTSGAFSPDGKFIVTGSADKTVRVWNAASGTPITTLTAHSGNVNTVAYDHSGRHFVSASADGSAIIWETAAYHQVLPLRAGSALLSALYTPDGLSVLTSGSDGNVKVWEPGLGTLITTFSSNSKATFTALAFSPDGKIVAVGGSDRIITLLDAQTRQSIAQIQSNHSGGVTSLTYSPDGKTLASGGGDSVQLWDVATRQSLASLSASVKATTNSVAFSPDGKRIVAGSSDNLARIWDVASKSIVTELSGHSGSVNSVAFSPDGHQVLTASADGSARLWTIATKANTP